MVNGRSRRWSALLVGAVAMFALVGAAACGDDDDDDDDATLVATEVAVDVDADADGEAVELADLTATLTEMDGSGASGSATLGHDDDGLVMIDVTVADHPGGEGSFANHVHHGSCAELGEVHVPLSNLETDADGNADGSTTLAADGDFGELALDHFAAGHYVAVHDGGGAVITCGDVS